VINEMRHWIPLNLRSPCWRFSGFRACRRAETWSAVFDLAPEASTSMDSVRPAELSLGIDPVDVDDNHESDDVALLGAHAARSR
jgi:hypothetical protein